MRTHMKLCPHCFRVTHGIHTVCYGRLVKLKSFNCNEIESIALKRLKAAKMGRRPVWKGKDFSSERGCQQVPKSYSSSWSRRQLHQKEVATTWGGEETAPM